ncbi:MAG TPA: hypothetical protein VGN57_15380 [Pirellulaceae bacterium]|jgi:hypothetical protein|nr:hypothetical protein [Pirellulaceae bacterium]
MKRLLGPALAALLAGFVLIAPSAAIAQDDNGDAYRDRRQTHNWDDQSKEKRTDQNYRDKERYQRAQERARQAKEEWDRDQQSRKQSDQRSQRDQRANDQRSQNERSKNGQAKNAQANRAQANRGDRQKDEISGQGQVRRTKKVGLRGQPVEHLVVLFRAPGSDRDRVADLGPVKNVRDARVRQGDNLRLIGRVVKIGDEQVLMVRKFYTSREPDRAIVIVRANANDSKNRSGSSKNKASQQRNQDQRTADRNDRDRTDSRDDDSQRRRQESRSNDDWSRSANRQSGNQNRDSSR